MFGCKYIWNVLVCVRNYIHFLFLLSSLFETLQSLFWSVFGLINLYVTNVKARHEFTEFVGATMFGTYNVISLVVLLNMLIAMMNNSYQLIAVSSSFCLLFILKIIAISIVQKFTFLKGRGSQHYKYSSGPFHT